MFKTINPYKSNSCSSCWSLKTTRFHHVSRRTLHKNARDTSPPLWTWQLCSWAAARALLPHKVRAGDDVWWCQESSVSFDLKIPCLFLDGLNFLSFCSWFDIIKSVLYIESESDRLLTVFSQSTWCSCCRCLRSKIQGFFGFQVPLGLLSDFGRKNNHVSTKFIHIWFTFW